MIISQSHSWTLSRLPCTQSTINNLGVYTDGGGAYTGEPFIMCQLAPASCTSVGFTNIFLQTYCTDFSSEVQSSSGALITKMTLSRTANIIVGFNSSAWATVIKTSTGAASSTWKVMTRIDLTQSYPINSSPGTVLLDHITFINDGDILL